MDLLGVQQADPIVKSWMADTRISIHAILDRIDGATLKGPGGIPMFILELGKVKEATTEETGK